MIKTLLIPLFFFCIQLAKAQSFEPGYVVLAQGDTLRGEVENAFWSDPPDKVRFRPTVSAPPTTYTSQQLSSVALQSGRLLRREALPLDRSAQVQLSRLTHGLQHQQRLDSVLADVLVIGPATLLEVKLDDVKHFLVRRETQPYIELAERLYLSGENKIVDGNNYHNQLLLYFNDCPAAVAVSAKTPFTTAGIISVVQEYNRQCSNTKQAGQEWESSEKARSKVALQVGPILGVRYNSLRLHRQNPIGVETATLDGVNLYGKLRGQVGFYADAVLPGRRIALHTALLYSRYGNTTKIAGPGGVGTEGTVDSRGSVATLYIGLRRLYVLEHYQLVAGAGLEVPYYWENAYTIRYNLYGNRPSFTSFYAGFAQSWVPYVEGGIKRNRMTISLLARRYGKEIIQDDLVVRAVTLSADGTSSYTERYNYTGRTWSVALALAYQLNTNTDKRAER